MSRDDDRLGTNRRQPGRHRARPGLEGLEDRLLLYATNGGEWSQPIRVTFSFAPDGTGVGGTPSTLFQSLNARYPTATWAIQFMQAAAIWEQVANINLVKVNDDGAPLGGGPDQQGDPNHGDIRIAGVAQPLSQLAITFTPPPINGGDVAGDIVLNTGESWQINNGADDLLTVAIHEFGHALGLGESQIEAAVMYGYYNGIKQSLTSDDIAGIQSVYGARQPDPWYNSFHDGTMSSAIDVTPLIDGNGQVTVSRLDINATVPTEWWKVTVPSSNNGSMTVSMQSTNLSELSPALLVYNSQGIGIGTAVAAGDLGATVSYTVSNVTTGQVYYFRALAANQGPSSAGGYGLLVNFGNLPQPPIPAAYTTIPDQPSKGGGGDPNVATRADRPPSRIGLGSLAGADDSFRLAPSPVNPYGLGMIAPPSPGNLAGPGPIPLPATPTALLATDDALGQLAGTVGAAVASGRRQSSSRLLR